MCSGISYYSAQGAALVRRHVLEAAPLSPVQAWEHQVSLLRQESAGEERPGIAEAMKVDIFTGG